MTQPQNQPGDSAAPTAGDGQGQGDKPAGTPDPAAPGDKPKDEPAKPEGPPEKYEFTMPEGVEVSADTITEFSAVAKEIGLSQANAQAVLGRMGTWLAKSQADQIAAVHAQWAEQAKADKEIGGDKLPDTVATAKKAIERFGGEKVVSMLNETGLGNHPEIIRTFARIGALIKEDTVEGDGNPTGAKAQQLRTPGRALYG